MVLTVPNSLEADSTSRLVEDSAESHQYILDQDARYQGAVEEMEILSSELNDANTRYF